MILAACWVTSQCSSQQLDLYGDKPPPNIVILYSDDAGFADFGFQPNAADDAKPLTPEIDSIARDGAGLPFVRSPIIAELE